ncbi:MAG: sodium-dependent transporter [Alphaproteobacteria bacterium]
MKDGFKSGWGFILAAAGSAIGLGNIWRFPYLVGEYGGFAFIVTYLIIVFLVCNPIMVAEISLGRTSRSNMVDAYDIVGKKTGIKNLWIYKIFGGYAGLVGLFLISSFYFLVAGWVLFYLKEIVNGDLLNRAKDDFSIIFSDLSKDFYKQYFYGSMFLFLTASVVYKGVSNGIEKVCVALTPLLFLFFIIMAINSISLDDAFDGLKFLFTPDISQINTVDKFSKMVLSALGQAFISLSLGYGMLLVYGSYFPKEEKLFKSVKFIEFFDVFAALLSAIIILPAIFSVGLDQSSGPGLTFISLPIVFKNITGGFFWSIIFYSLLCLATLTSTISVYEGMSNFFINKYKKSRKDATIITFFMVFFGFSFVCASFSGYINLNILGKDLFYWSDYISSTYIAAIVSITMSIFVGYKAMKSIMKNIQKSDHVSKRYLKYFLITLKYIAPISLFLLLILSII